MKPAVADRVEHHKDDETEIRQTKNRQWPTVSNETKRNARDRRRQQVRCSKQHESFVNIEAPAVIKRGGDQNAEDEHVAERNDEKRQGRGRTRHYEAWVVNEASCGEQARQYANDENEGSQTRADYAETLMRLRASLGYECYLHDEQHDPRGHDDAVCVDDQTRQCGSAKEALEIVSA